MGSQRLSRAPPAAPVPSRAGGDPVSVGGGGPSPNMACPGATPMAAALAMGALPLRRANPPASGSSTRARTPVGLLQYRYPFKASAPAMAGVALAVNCRPGAVKCDFNRCHTPASCGDHGPLLGNCPGPGQGDSVPFSWGSQRCPPTP